MNTLGIYNHFNQRLQERHQLSMSKKEFRDWSLIIHNAPTSYRVDHTTLNYNFRKTNTRYLVKIKHKKKDLMCVYSKKTKCLITVLP